MPTGVKQDHPEKNLYPKLEAIRKKLSRFRPGENEKTKYAGMLDYWYCPKYPTSYIEFIPERKIAGARTSVILPEFWQVMYDLINKDTEQAFNAFKLTIESLPNEGKIPVRYLLPNGKLFRQPLNADEKYAISPFYFFLPDPQFSHITFYTDAHAFVKLAQERKAKKYLDVIYTKISQIIDRNNYNQTDNDIGPVCKKSFWAEICNKNFNEDDEYNIASIYSNSILSPGSTIDSPLDYSLNLHETLAAKQTGKTPPRKTFTPRAEENYTTPSKKPAQSSIELSDKGSSTPKQNLHTPEQQKQGRNSLGNTPASPLHTSPAVKAMTQRLSGRILQDHEQHEKKTSSTKKANPASHQSPHSLSKTPDENKPLAGKENQPASSNRKTAVHCKLFPSLTKFPSEHEARNVTKRGETKKGGYDLSDSPHRVCRTEVKKPKHRKKTATMSHTPQPKPSMRF